MTVPIDALPTARTPPLDSVIPAGSDAPPESKPKRPPFVMPTGRVVERLNVELVPTRRGGTEGFHVSGAGGGVGTGGGVGVGVGVGAGADPSGDDASLPPPHPASVVTATARLCFSRRRRSVFSCTGFKPLVPLRCFMQGVRLKPVARTQRSWLSGHTCADMVHRNGGQFRLLRSAKRSDGSGPIRDVVPMERGELDMGQQSPDMIRGRHGAELSHAVEFLYEAASSVWSNCGRSFGRRLPCFWYRPIRSMAYMR